MSSPVIHLSYEKLLKILEPLPKEDSDYVLKFLLANDAKARKAALAAEMARREYESIYRECQHRLRVLEHQHKEIPA